MASPLEGLAKTINGALGNIFLDATLTRNVVPSTPSYDPADPPAPVPTNYACKAIRDSYSIRDMQGGSLILQGDVKILILAESLAVVPQKRDIITIQGSSFVVIDFGTDPATAVWTIQGRR
jgi:hypothetical protein